MANVIHIVGTSGAGTSTLARALERGRGMARAAALPRAAAGRLNAGRGVAGGEGESVGGGRTRPVGASLAKALRCYLVPTKITSPSSSSLIVRVWPLIV